MKASMKVVVVGALALTVLFASSAITSALPNFTAGTVYCTCACATSAGNVALWWQKVGTCSLANGKNCTGTKNGKTYSGKLYDCEQCTGTADGGCNYLATSGAVSGALSTGGLPATQGPTGTTTTTMPKAPSGTLAPVAPRR
jgi:hypothetical protein